MRAQTDAEVDAAPARTQTGAEVDVAPVRMQTGEEVDAAPARTQTGAKVDAARGLEGATRHKAAEQAPTPPGRLVEGMVQGQGTREGER